MQKTKTVILFDIDCVLFDTAFFKQSGLLEYKIYSEVMRVLGVLSAFATLGIFSKGEVQFQKTKLEKTKIAKFFKEKDVHIFPDKDVNLENVLERYEGSNLFLIDDKLDVLSAAKRQAKKVFTIWVKRGWYAENQEPISGFTPDAEVENLLGVVRIVKSNLQF